MKKLIIIMLMLFIPTLGNPCPCCDPTDKNCVTTPTPFGDIVSEPPPPCPPNDPSCGFFDGGGCAPCPETPDNNDDTDTDTDTTGGWCFIGTMGG